MSENAEVTHQFVVIDGSTEEGNAQFQQLRKFGGTTLNRGIHQRLAHRFQHLVEGEVILVDVNIRRKFRLQRRPLVGIVLLRKLVEGELAGKIAEGLTAKICDGLGFFSSICLFQHLADDGWQQIHLHIHFDYQIFREQSI